MSGQERVARAPDRALAVARLGDDVQVRLCVEDDAGAILAARPFAR